MRGTAASCLETLSQKITETTGLMFRPGSGELESFVAKAARDFGFTETASLVEWLLSGAPTELERQRMVNCLTIGETYFWREPEVFAALESQVLPALAKTALRPLRLWCAGCSTGEESYSLAIAVVRTLGRQAVRDLSILATDLNTDSLEKARQGVYPPWAFRNAPAWFKDRFFRPAGPDRWEIREDLRLMVDFVPGNLIRQPASETTESWDLILCRNVLMYFSPEWSQAVVDHFHRCLSPGGYLLVSASELSLGSLSVFSPHRLATTQVYRKLPPVPASVAPVPVPMPSPVVLNSPVLSRVPPPPAPPLDLVRHLADQGRGTEALVVCGQVIQDRPLDAAAYYLQAVLLQEAGETARAITSYRRVLYLDPGHILASLSLGHLFHTTGQEDAARIHFRNAEEAAGRLGPDKFVPESDGLTAGQVRRLVGEVLAGEAP